MRGYPDFNYHDFLDDLIVNGLCILPPTYYKVDFHMLVSTKSSISQLECIFIFTIYQALRDGPTW